MGKLTVADIRRKLQEADSAAFAVLERSLVADERKGVREAIEVARRRLDAEEAERHRLDSLYAFEEELAQKRDARCWVGLDEVGRGPLAGPLAVGAVVLDRHCKLEGLNDSKQIASEKREELAKLIKQQALAWSVQYVEPADIDRLGMTASLKQAFRAALAAVEKQGVAIDLVLLDGNPLHLDEREVNIIKGDGKCASIAAASIVAKVERDALMVKLDNTYPGYGWAQNKGYASPEHIAAIKSLGLSPVHRESFCTAFTQPSLF